MSIEGQMRLMVPYNGTSDKFPSSITTFEIGRIWFNPAVDQLRVFDVAQMFSDIRVGRSSVVKLVYSASVTFRIFTELEMEASAPLTWLIQQNTPVCALVDCFC